MLRPEEAWNRQNLLILYKNEKPTSFDAEMEFTQLFDGLKDLDGAVINCDEHRTHCQEKNVTTVPQIIYVTEQYRYQYKGDIVTENVKTWLEKVTTSVLTQIDSESDHIHIMERRNIGQYFILHTPESLEDAEQFFYQFRGRLQIAYLHRKCKPVLKAYRQGKTAQFYDLDNKEALLDFINTNIVPIFGPINKYNFDYLINLHSRTKLFLVANLSNPRQKNLAQKYKTQILNNYNENKDVYDKFIFGYVNLDKKKSFMFTIASKAPYFTSVIKHKGELKYALIEVKNQKFDEILEKVNKVTLKQYYSAKKLQFKLIPGSYKVYMSVKIISSIIIAYTFILVITVVKTKIIDAYISFKAKNKKLQVKKSD